MVPSKSDFHPHLCRGEHIEAHRCEPKREPRALTPARNDELFLIAHPIHAILGLQTNVTHSFSVLTIDPLSAPNVPLFTPNDPYFGLFDQNVQPKSNRSEMF